MKNLTKSFENWAPVASAPLGGKSHKSSQVNHLSQDHSGPKNCLTTTHIHKSALY